MDQKPVKASRRPRSDSLRNRDRLIAAARDVFAEGGAGASLEAVARRAEVGIGTLYRHFPSRDALFQSVYRQEIDDLVALAEQSSADPDPAGAMRRWLHANIRVVATKKGMLAALTPSPDSSRALYADTRTRVVAAATALLGRAQASGAMREDINGAELLQALYGICYAYDGPHWQANVTRLVDVFIDGLTLRRGPTPAPTP